jgi:hypothetical protein
MSVVAARNKSNRRIVAVSYICLAFRRSSGRITRYSEKALMALLSHFIARWQISANQAAVTQ